MRRDRPNEAGRSSGDPWKCWSWATGDILLIGGESFDGDENGWGGNDEDKEGVDMRHGKVADLDGQRVGQGQMGRFISGRGWEIWHSYGGGLECKWK